MDPFILDEQRQDIQLGQHTTARTTYNSFVPIQDVALRTYQKWWTIERGDRRGSGISVLMARYHNDNDDDDGSSHWSVYGINNIFFSFKIQWNIRFWYLWCFQSQVSRDCEYFFIFYHIYPTPPLRQDMTQGQFFKRSLTGLNSEFSFS